MTTHNHHRHKRHEGNGGNYNLLKHLHSLMVISTASATVLAAAASASNALAGDTEFIRRTHGPNAESANAVELDLEKRGIATRFGDNKPPQMKVPGDTGADAQKASALGSLKDDVVLDKGTAPTTKIAANDAKKARPTPGPRFDPTAFG